MKKLAIFGAGLSTIGLIKNMMKENPYFEITLVEPKDYIEIPFPMLRALFENQGLGDISREKIKRVFSGIIHVQSKLRTLHENKAELENGETLEFDYAVIGTGANSRGYTELRMNSAQTLQERKVLWDTRGVQLRKAKSIVIAGGGVIGVELAGEILEANPNVKMTMLSGSERLLSHMAPSAGNKALKVLKSLGKNVEVYFNDRVDYDEGMESFSLNEIKTVSGKTYEADVIILALGNKFDSDFMSDNFEGAIIRNGRIKVNEYLQLEQHPHIFVVGDISSANLVGLGHIALEHSQLTYDNLIALEQNKELTSFAMGKKDKIEFITIGHKKGIVQTPIGRFDFLITLKTKANFFAEKIIATGKSR